MPARRAHAQRVQVPVRQLPVSEITPGRYLCVAYQTPQTSRNCASFSEKQRVGCVFSSNFSACTYSGLVQITHVNFPPPYNRERKIAYVEFVDEEAMNAGMEKHAEVLLDFTLIFCHSDPLTVRSSRN
jgi:hypothetical protein